VIAEWGKEATSLIKLCSYYIKIVTLIKMEWVRHVACMGQIQKYKKYLIEETGGKV
jgi:hypothetical protein